MSLTFFRCEIFLVRGERIECRFARQIFFFGALEAFLLRMTNVIGPIAGPIVERLLRLQNGLIRSDGLTHRGLMFQEIAVVGTFAFERVRGRRLNREKLDEEVQRDKRITPT